jgi:hypothetical protein
MIAAGDRGQGRPVGIVRHCFGRFAIGRDPGAEPGRFAVEGAVFDLAGGDVAFDPLAVYQLRHRYSPNMKADCALPSTWS